jgi:hypothetical protein
MIFGHNTDVKVGEAVYHLQTEDRGAANALIDTTVYCRGRVLHRQTNNYFDLLPLDAEREELLKKRIIEQHRTVAEEVRSGILHLVPPPLPVQEKSTAKAKTDSAARPKVVPAPELALELINAKTWLAGKRANLHVAVRKKQNGEAIVRALVTARVDGAAELAEFSTETGANGEARLEFEMPQLAGSESALVIMATHADSKAHLKFQLRAKPRVPAAVKSR